MGKSGIKSTANPWTGKKLTQEQPKIKAVKLIPHQENGLPFLSFSFRYAAQQEFFGIAGEDASWFASLQDRLKDLSSKTGSIVDNKEMRDTYRLHPIDWKAKNCPISIDDLKSVPDVIKHNDTEDFFWQFQLSKGTGRVVGFFNEEHSVFYIVLLDPKHNIQPSKDYGYVVDPTKVAVTEYERVRLQIHEMKVSMQTCPHAGDCPICSRLQDEYTKSDRCFIPVDRELCETFTKLAGSGELERRIEEILLEEFCSGTTEE